MKLNIVEPYHTTAMRRMTAPFEELTPLYDVTFSDIPDTSADINFHCPWHSLSVLEDLGTSKHIMAYTHVNPPDVQNLLRACDKADLITCMSFTGRDELIELGVDPKKLWVVYCAANGFPFRKRRILVVGYIQPNGRKRENLLIDLAWKYDLSPYQFIMAGLGWEDTAEKLKALNVAVSVLNADTDDKLVQAYHYADLFLATGYAEGGPLPLLEAMACGVPVLSPPFGYAKDLLDGENIYTDIDDLMGKLDKFIQPQVKDYQLVNSWMWGDYIAEYALLFGRLIDHEVNVYPKRGVSRYMQLLDIIKERKPRHIVEIGAWNGNRAIQMIQEAQKYNKITYQGFDLFEGQTAADLRKEFSKAGYPENVVRKRIEATGAKTYLYKGYTRDTLKNLMRADLYFVDGGHSEETIAQDAEKVLSLLDGSNVAIFDDYYHEGKPEGIGCNKLIDNLGGEYRTELLPNITDIDGLKIGMVKVSKNEIHLQGYQWSYTTDGIVSV